MLRNALKGMEEESVTAPSFLLQNDQKHDMGREL